MPPVLLIHWEVEPIEEGVPMYDRVVKRVTVHRDRKEARERHALELRLYGTAEIGALELEGGEELVADINVRPNRQDEDPDDDEGGLGRPAQWPVGPEPDPDGGEGIEPEREEYLDATPEPEVTHIESDRRA